MSSLKEADVLKHRGSGKKLFNSTRNSENYINCGHASIVITLYI